MDCRGPLEAPVSAGAWAEGASRSPGSPQESLGPRRADGGLLLARAHAVTTLGSSMATRIEVNSTNAATVRRMGSLPPRATAQIRGGLWAMIDSGSEEGQV